MSDHVLSGRKYNIGKDLSKSQELSTDQVSYPCFMQKATHQIQEHFHDTGSTSSRPTTKNVFAIHWRQYDFDYEGQNLT